MKIEVRADGKTYISGYVNAVERESRPVSTTHGMVTEKICQGAFKKALRSGENISMTVDHMANRTIANTKDGTLKLCEDNIGLRAEAVTTDIEIGKSARNGLIKGWSFGMKVTEDELEERGDKISLRMVKALELDHVTLVVQKNPVYSATSVEVRGGEDTSIETRGSEDVDIAVTAIDNSYYTQTIKQLKGE